MTITSRVGSHKFMVSTLGSLSWMPGSGGSQLTYCEQRYEETHGASHGGLQSPATQE
jgi:hypothetical protein